jgi:hypothetical protein
MPNANSLRSASRRHVCLSRLVDVPRIPSAAPRSALFSFSAPRRIIPPPRRTNDAERLTRVALHIGGVSARLVFPPLTEPRSAIPLHVASHLVDDPAMPNANFVPLCFLAPCLFVPHRRRTFIAERGTALRYPAQLRVCSSQLNDEPLMSSAELRSALLLGCPSARPASSTNR